MNLWGLEFKGKLEPVALAKRKYIQVYAGRRFLGAGEFRRAYGRDHADEFLPYGNVKAVWKACKRQNPTLRLVVVSVRPPSRSRQ